MNYLVEIYRKDGERFAVRIKYKSLHHVQRLWGLVYCYLEDRGIEFDKIKIDLI